MAKKKKKKRYLLRRDAASLTSQNPFHCDGPDTPSMVPCLAAATCPNDPLPCPTMIRVVSLASETASRISLRFAIATDDTCRHCREDALKIKRPVNVCTSKEGSSSDDHAAGWFKYSSIIVRVRGNKAFAPEYVVVVVLWYYFPEQ